MPGSIASHRGREDQAKPVYDPQRAAPFNRGSSKALNLQGKVLGYILDVPHEGMLGTIIVRKLDGYDPKKFHDVHDVTKYLKRNNLWPSSRDHDELLRKRGNIADSVLDYTACAVKWGWLRKDELADTRNAPELLFGAKEGDLVLLRVDDAERTGMNEHQIKLEGRAIENISERIRRQDPTYRRRYETRLMKREEELRVQLARQYESLEDLEWKQKNLIPEDCRIRNPTTSYDNAPKHLEERCKKELAAIPSRIKQVEARISTLEAERATIQHSMHLLRNKTWIDPQDIRQPSYRKSKSTAYNPQQAYPGYHPRYTNARNNFEQEKDRNVYAVRSTRPAPSPLQPRSGYPSDLRARSNWGPVSSRSFQRAGPFASTPSYAYARRAPPPTFPGDYDWNHFGRPSTRKFLMYSGPMGYTQSFGRRAPTTPGYSRFASPTSSMYGMSSMRLRRPRRNRVGRRQWTGPDGGHYEEDEWIGGDGSRNRSFSYSNTLKRGTGHSVSQSIHIGL